ncbi:MAG: hypothetical protein ACTHXO_03340 [Actinomycetaceae bacterium]
MADHGSRDHPSPVLSDDEVRHLLVEANAALGAAGGAVGGAIGGGAVGGSLSGLGGMAGGRSGGRTGGRVGARMFTKVHGAGRVVPVPPSAAAEQAVTAVLRTVLRLDRQVVLGLMGSGSMNMNTAVVQVQWLPDRTVLTAHGLEGWIKQRTAPKALDRLETALLGARPHT